jgi:hypothetical protein
MSLKIKGRYLEETALFEDEMGKLPSLKSQKKVIRGYSYQMEDEFDDMRLKLRSSKSLFKKQ